MPGTPLSLHVASRTSLLAPIEAITLNPERDSVVAAELANRFIDRLAA